MAKDPAFLFYPGDFTTGTQFFTDEQVGKYIRLLMAQHQLGHLEEKHMIMICKTYDKDVFSKFDKDSNGLYFNQRLDDEILKRKKYSESRSKNRTSKNDISSTYDEHMENRDKDINNINKPNNLVEFLLKELPNTSHIESIAMIHSVSKETIINLIPKFKKSADLTYPTPEKFYNHFKNWVNIQLKQTQQTFKRKAL